MATVYKREETGTWYAKYFDADGRRVSKNTGSSSKREAERIAAGFESGERAERQKANQLPKAFAVILETVTREAASGDLTLARAEEFVHRLHKLANPNFKESSLEDFWKSWITEQKRHVGEPVIGGVIAGEFASRRRLANSIVLILNEFEGVNAGSEPLEELALGSHERVERPRAGPQIGQLRALFHVHGEHAEGVESKNLYDRVRGMEGHAAVFRSSHLLRPP